MKITKDTIATVELKVANKLGQVNRVAGVLLGGFGLLLVGEMVWKILR